MISEYFNKADVSLYQPSNEVIDVTRNAKYNFQRGYEVIHSPYPELNDRAVKDDEANGKKIWNAYVEEQSDDPREAWKWRGTRSEARKRGVAMHAQLTAGYLFAGIAAQDDDDKEDREAGDFMRSLVEWMAENSDYMSSFIQVSQGMMYNPVTYLGAEFATVKQKIREKIGRGYEIKEVLDEHLSGFRAPVYAPTDIYVTNAYISPFNFQRQHCIVKNKYLDYSDAQKKYGNHPNWNFVQKGIVSVFNDEDGLFYDVKDDENPQLVKETIFEWRADDLEIPFLGGVYMGNENVEWNPIKHRDLDNNPMYDVTPFGYSLISEHFAFYKSLMNNLQWEDSFYDEFSRNVMNRELLDLLPPTVTSGDTDGVVDTSVIFPGANISAKSADFSVKSILPPASGNRYAALAEIKKSMEDNSISDTQSGQLPEASQKATAINQATQSSRVLIRGLGKTLGQSIVAYTRLMVNIAVRHLTVPQVKEIVGGGLETRYRNFVLPNRVSKGKRVGKILRFNTDLMGAQMTDKEKEMHAIQLAEETGYPDSKSEILEANPEMATRMKYLISFDPEEMFLNNQRDMQILMQNMYAQLRADPLLNAEPFLREYMYWFFKSKGDDFINASNPTAMPMNPMNQNPEQQQNPKMPTPLNNPVGAVA